jgi:hypothetical protein
MLINKEIKMKTKLTLVWLVLIITLTPLGNTVSARNGNPSHEYKTSLRFTKNRSLVQPKIAPSDECLSMDQKVIQLIGMDEYKKIGTVSGGGLFGNGSFSWPKTSRSGRYYHFNERDFTVFWSPGTCAYEVNGLIRVKYRELGWEKSVCGFPITDELPTPNGIGRFNHFENCSIYWTPATGAHEVHGAIRDHWASLGWERSLCGFPITDELPTPDRIGRFNHFENCSIYWTPATGAHEVHGAIRDHWASMGWERSWLGYPISDELSTEDGGGRISQFQNGYIIWYPDNRYGTATWAQAFPSEDFLRRLRIFVGPVVTGSTRTPTPTRIPPSPSPLAIEPGYFINQTANWSDASTTIQGDKRIDRTPTSITITGPGGTVARVGEWEYLVFGSNNYVLMMGIQRMVQGQGVEYVVNLVDFTGTTPVERSIFTSTYASTSAGRPHVHSSQVSGSAFLVYTPTGTDIKNLAIYRSDNGELLCPGPGPFIPTSPEIQGEATATQLIIHYNWGKLTCPIP